MQYDWTISKDGDPAYIVTFEVPFRDPKMTMQGIFEDVFKGETFKSHRDKGVRFLIGDQGTRINLHERIGAATLRIYGDNLEELRRRIGRGIIHIVRSRKRRIPDLLAPRYFAPSGPATAKPLSWALELLEVNPDQNFPTGKNVTVAVLDTGIDTDHPDFVGRINSGEIIGHSFVSGQDFEDQNGHGTFCAGVIAGPKQTGGSYRYGVAPDVKLIVAKIIGGSEQWDDNILPALDWAEGEGADVISMSFGAYRNETDPPSEAYEDIAAVLRDSGTFLVAAAGNYSVRQNYQFSAVMDPAAVPSIFAVTAVDKYKQVWDGACMTIGQWGEVEISAPGVKVYSSWKGGGHTGDYSGTSFATAYVASIAALYIEKHGPPSVNVLVNYLKTSAASPYIGPVEVYGEGLVRAPNWP